MARVDVPQEHPHHNNNNSTSTPLNKMGALDRPLPIASAKIGGDGSVVWKSRPKIHRTLRRIATLTTAKTATTMGAANKKNKASSTKQQQQQQQQQQQHDPVLDNASSSHVCIAGEEYIVVANTVASSLYIFRLTTNSVTADDSLVTPWAVVSLSGSSSSSSSSEDHAASAHSSTTTESATATETSSSTNSHNNNTSNIVSVMALPFGQSIIYGERLQNTQNEGHIVAVTDDGRCFIVRITTGTTTKDAAATAKLLFDFSTLNFGVTCACTIAEAATKENDNNQQPHTLLVGYQSGYIEQWKIFRFSTDNILAKMMWRGRYPNHHAIQRMAPLNTVTTSSTCSTTADFDSALHDPEEADNQNIRTGDNNDHDTKDHKNDAVTQSPPKRKSPTSSTATAPTQSQSPKQIQPPKQTQSSLKRRSSGAASSRESTPIATARKVVTAPPTPTTTSTSNNTSTSSSGLLVRDKGQEEPHQYLVVTVFSPNYTPPKTSAMVEVIDIGSMATDWKSKKQDPADHPGGHLRAIHLGKRWILPAPEQELLNSLTTTTIGGSSATTSLPPSMASNSHHQHDPGTNNYLPRRAHVIPSTATGSICEHPQGNCVALADGTIALLSSTKTKNGELQWGVANDHNQLLLPYPAIGCASLNWSASRQQNSKPHVACCLRGGSSYLVPFVSSTEEEEEDDNDSATDTPITVFTLDTETHAKYVHSFTAGNLIISSSSSSHSVSSSNDTTDNHNNASTSSTGITRTDSSPATITMTTPVLIYGWAGGMIDVYSCDLMMETLSANTTTTTESSFCRPIIGHREESALEELVSNGSISLLGKFLASSDDTEPLLRQPVWREARNEVRRASDDGSTLELISAKDLMLPKWRATRSILLLLSTNTLQLPD